MPERPSWISRLLRSAHQTDPAKRELRATQGDELRTKVVRLLTRYLATVRSDAPDPPTPFPHATGSWIHSGCRDRDQTRVAEISPDSFSPQSGTCGEVTQTRRLFAISMAFNLIACGTVFYRWLLPDHGRVFWYLDVAILPALAVGIVLGAVAIVRYQRLKREQLFGQYRLLQRIGAGGMGEVYLAEHRLLKRPCAVKLIRSDSADDPKALARFEQEVRLTATLSHPNTVEVYDYGRTSDGAYYYVMEYLPGLNLEELVERFGPLPPGRAVYLLRQVCRALREAHGIGLVHRDIKPSNIIAAHRGGMDDVAKLLDFGLVRFVSSPAPDLTGEGRLAGTPLYMSPEQVMDQELDARSDIYSLGAVAYYLLTGRPPFDKTSGVAVMLAHISDCVIPPSRIVNCIPKDLEQVVLRCLAKDAADRFLNVESLEQALKMCVCTREWDATTAGQWWHAWGGNAVMSTVG